ncbi:membrane-spanning 4-domains subfamily A member 8-like isoform X2 [Aquarana catesbeiana]|uniref:membrane-spanning 4-domains subfamily A member 8-like isoform X2 n=1 Tax=Aquarana catesbeiana TaxID=8400 RepID=UPI003CC95D3D
MSSPVNQETGNNYGTQQYNMQTGAVLLNSQNNYPALMTQSPPMGHVFQVGPPLVSVSNFQPGWTVVPQAYLLNFYEAFLKGKPKSLGSLVIIVAILEIALGIISFFIGNGIITFYSFTSFWCPVFYIIAGSLTVAAQPKPNLCLKYSIVVVSLLLAANGLLLFVTFSTSIFGCNSMSKLNSTFPQQLVIRNDGVFAVNLGVPMTAATYGNPAEPQQPLPANNVRVPIQY